MNVATLLSPNPSLLKLSRMQLLGAFRSLTRMVFTLPGLYIVLILAAVIFPFFFDKNLLVHWASRMLIVFGPLTLGFLVIYSIRIGLSGTAFYFTPAETNFLMPSPITKDELLAYKLHQYHFAGLITSAAVSVHLTRSWMEFARLYSSAYLVITCLILLPLVVGSLCEQRQSKLLLSARLGVDFFMGVFLFSVAGAIFFRLAGNLKLALISEKVFRFLTLPFDYFYRYFGSADYQKVLIGTIVLAAFNLLLLCIFLLRSRHIEIESIFYKNLQQHRLSVKRLKGTVVAPAHGVFKGSLAHFPHWGGLGVVLWAKIHELTRGYRNTLLPFILLGLGYTALSIFILKTRIAIEPNDPILGWQLVYFAQIVALIALLFSGFADFRSDADKIEILKSLPLPPWAVTLGYLVFPTITLCVFMWVLECIAFFLVNRYFPEFPAMRGLAAAAVFTPVMAFVFAAAANLCFLIFPVRGEIHGKLIGNVLLQFFALVICNIALAAALGTFLNWLLEYSITLSSPLLGYSGIALFVLLVVGLILFALMNLRFKLIDVTKFGN